MYTPIPTATTSKSSPVFLTTLDFAELDFAELDFAELFGCFRLVAIR
ncbi:hypothetical protein RMSM_00227 [Rhodopirellula maiorica SM1]|uniref:Uncharacterized protein n=1 Tax=Rhodopirellula maiorica SM1 TaxID=1265738 RepID=M5S5H4_9BACT|nr:hypothetical protein RMSM_00227 [Rhodopirellula maiorica SM1]